MKYFALGPAYPPKDDTAFVPYHGGFIRLVLLVGAAAAQQFAAVRLARPGFFQQSGSSSFRNAGPQSNGNFQQDRSSFTSESFQQGAVSGQTNQFQLGSNLGNQNQVGVSQFQSEISLVNQGQSLEELSSRRQSELSANIDGEFEPLNLPAEASLLLGRIDTSFQCADRPYGYYADVANDCRVFHVCNPYLFDDGHVETYQYSFMCGEGQAFDQKVLSCVEKLGALPCQESDNFYFRNEEFGRPEEKF